MKPAPPSEPAAPEPLFAKRSEEQLTDLGVAPSLIPVVAAPTTEDQLLGLVEYAPQLTGEVLSALYDGKGYDDALEQVTAPVAAPEPVDPEGFRAAVECPATIVTRTDDALREVLEGEDFGRWKVFLHPTQAKLVTRDYSGPARVGGGPGTGTTIVALHRVKHPMEHYRPQQARPADHVQDEQAAYPYPAAHLPDCACPGYSAPAASSSRTRSLRPYPSSEAR
nr:hypothetical protein [Streptomyces sp. NTH33]